MKIVIDIPEDIYTRLFDNGIQDNKIATDDICEMARSIRLGILLPKEHGRLIDADVAKKEFNKRAMDWEGGVIDCIATIIEADKENKE